MRPHILAVVVIAVISLNVHADLTVVNVKPGQTLNAAIADVDGPVCVMLPAGVTEHDAAVTRNATVVIKGQGEGVSILRPAASLGPDDGVALIEQSEPHDGDLILSDFTYDRMFHPGVTPADPADKPRQDRHDENATTGAIVLHVAAGGRCELRNLYIYHFDFGARENVKTNTLAFNFDGNHQKAITFENVEIDFKRDGGIRHRPGARSRAFNFGDVDRLTFDRNCVIRAHLCQSANPEYTVGPVWRNRGKAGTMYGMNARVYEYAFIDGEYIECDYGVSRSVDAATEDAIIEWRMDVLDAGYGDQFWQGRLVDGGHMIFKDVLLTGNTTGELWNDYGLRAHGIWKTITVDGCTVINRGHPLSFLDPSSGSRRQGQITIRNTTLVPLGTGLVIGGFESIEGVSISGLNVYRHPSRPGFDNAIEIGETGEGGAVMTISDVRADGYLYHLIHERVGPKTEIHTANVHGRRVTLDSIVEDAYPIATQPAVNLPLDKIDGNPDEAADMKPVATIKDFAHTDAFSQIDLYFTQSSRDGVHVMVIVGDDEFGNNKPYPDRLYRGDAIQFAITSGKPGETMGYTLWDIAKHDEHGLTAYRRNFWPDKNLSTGIVDIPMAIKFHEDKKQIVYEFILPWEEIGLPAPWYANLCIDLAVGDGREYGAHYKGAYWVCPYESVENKSGIFHKGKPASRAFKWIAIDTTQ